MEAAFSESERKKRKCSSAHDGLSVANCTPENISTVPLQSVNRICKTGLGSATLR
jgi:hypothetical protein